jgi:hypothetical protein
MCSPVRSFQRDPERLKRWLNKLLQVASRGPLAIAKPNLRAVA